MQELLHDDFHEIYEVSEAIKNAMRPASVVVIEDFNNNMVVVTFDGKSIALTDKGASDLALRLHHAIRKIRKADHNHPKNRG